MWIIFTAKYAQRLWCGHMVNVGSTVVRNMDTRETRCRKCHEAATGVDMLDAAREKQQALNEKMRMD